MADTVRIYWKKHELVSRKAPYWSAYVWVDGKHTFIFGHSDPDEFFARYNALTVTKEPPPEAELTKEDEKNIAYTVGYLKEACQLIDEINGTNEPGHAPEKPTSPKKTVYVSEEDKAVLRYLRDTSDDRIFYLYPHRLSPEGSKWATLDQLKRLNRKKLIYADLKGFPTRVWITQDGLDAIKEPVPQEEG